VVGVNRPVAAAFNTIPGMFARIHGRNASMAMRKLAGACCVAALAYAAVSAAAPAQARAVVDIAIGVAPPPLRVEHAGVRAGYVWAPGYWHWNGAHHVWIGGRWVVARPGYRYVGARWVRIGPDWHFRHAHWVRL
jgi:hypothetical protein